MCKRSIFISIFFILCFNVLFAVTPDETHPFSVHDLLAMDRISDPQVSPDGEWICFVLRKTDLEANRGRTDLWLVSVDGTGLRRFTSHPAGDFNPSWSPCGKFIWFLSTRSGSSQIWRLRMDGGEAVQVTDQPLNVGNLVVSPDGRHIAFTMEVYPDKGCPGCTKKELDKIAAQKYTGRIYESIFVRHWDTWKDGRRSHLFVMPCKGGKPVKLMKGMDADTPSKPFGGSEEITFTPDGKGLIFTARDVGREEAWSTDFDLYFVPIDGSKAPECLTEKNEAWDTGPVFSPDGKTLAYLAMSKPRYEADRFRIVLRSWPDGKERILTEDWDRSPGSICWSPDSKVIYATAFNLGQSSLFAVDVKTGKVRTVVKEGRVRTPVFAGRRIVYGLESLKSPVELYSVKPNGKDVRSIAAINAERLTEVRLGDYEQFAFKGWNDETVYC